MQTRFSVAPRDEVCAAPWTHQERLSSCETRSLTESGVTAGLSKCSLWEVPFSCSCELVACGHQPRISAWFRNTSETHLEDLQAFHCTKFLWTLEGVLQLASTFTPCYLCDAELILAASIWEEFLGQHSLFPLKTTQRKCESVVFFPSTSMASEETCWLSLACASWEHKAICKDQK